VPCDPSKLIMSDEETFDNIGSGASQTIPRQCSALRKNHYVVIKGRPCKIMDMSTSKTGKHGSAKVHMVALDIFSGKKYEEISPSTANMEVPNVQRLEYQLLDISTDNFLSLMCDDGTTKEDVQVPTGDVGKEIKEKWGRKGDEEFIVTVIKAMGEEAAIGIRTSTGKD